jgi:hypothetical protein
MLTVRKKTMKRGKRMNLTKCSNGHFYDSDTYASCPYCGGGNSAQVNNTVAYEGGTQSPDISATVDLDTVLPSDSQASDSVAEVLNSTMSQSVPSDDSKTISFWQTKKNEKNDSPVYEEAPVVGWLVCTKGKAYGQDFRLKSGRNFIGRSADMDVCLAGENTVSRERHAIIIHEPRKNIFIAQPGESRELFYVNDSVVLSSVEIKKNDVLQIGDVQLMLIPCCDDAFKWE